MALAEKKEKTANCSRGEACGCRGPEAWASAAAVRMDRLEIGYGSQPASLTALYLLVPSAGVFVLPKVVPVPLQVPPSFPGTPVDAGARCGENATDLPIEEGRLNPCPIVPHKFFLVPLACPGARVWPRGRSGSVDARPSRSTAPAQ